MRAGGVARSAPRKTHMAPLIILYFGLLMSGSAQDLPCAVSHGAGWTTYSVPEFNATSCHYWWANGTSHVMANHEGEIGYLVLTKSRITLTTNTCLEQVLYKRDCISEGISCQATCTTTCIGNAGLRGIRHHYSIAVFVVFTLLLVGLVLYAVRCGKCHRSNAEADVEAQLG